MCFLFLNKHTWYQNYPLTALRCGLDLSLFPVFIHSAVGPYWYYSLFLPRPKEKKQMAKRGRTYSFRNNLAYLIVHWRNSEQFSTFFIPVPRAVQGTSRMCICRGREKSVEQPTSSLATTWSIPFLEFETCCRGSPEVNTVFLQSY